MKRTTLQRASAGVLVALLLASCSTSGGSSDGPGVLGTSGSETTEAGSASTAPPTSADDTTPATVPGVPTTVDDQPTTLTLGETFERSDGVSITISEPRKFTPSEYAADRYSSPAFVVMDVKIKNDGEQNFDPIETYASAQSGDKEAEDIYDSEQDIGSPPSTSVLPGRSTSYKIAYGVQDSKDLVVEIRGRGDGNSAIWTS